MEKLQRNERVAALINFLSNSPGKYFTLGTFTEMFDAAKSTISEDIDIAEKLLKKFGIGSIQTIPGAAGGVGYMPYLSKEKTASILNSLCEKLSQNERALPGGYIYTPDLIYNPEIVTDIGQIFASNFMKKNPDYVITVETKGIPLAYMTAKYLNIPLVIARHYSEAADGNSVSINYVSGSSKRIQTMAVSIRAIKRNSNLLFIDDFMKGGGTANGIIELAREFDSKVVGIGVLIETETPEKKLVDDYFSLLTLKSIDEISGKISIKPKTKVNLKKN